MKLPTKPFGKYITLGLSLPLITLSLGFIIYSYNQSLGSMVFLLGLIGWVPGIFYLKSKQFNGLNFLGNSFLLFLFMVWHDMRELWTVSIFLTMLLVLIASIPLEFLLKKRVPKIAWFILRFLILLAGILIGLLFYGLVAIIPH